MRSSYSAKAFAPITLLQRACWAWLFIALAASQPSAASAGPILPKASLDALQLPEGVEEVDKAVEAFQRHEYEQALTLLKAAAKKRPDLTPPRIILAKLFFMDNQAPAGRTALEQAAVDEPEHPEIYVIFGKLALQDNRITDAHLHFDKASVLLRSHKLGDAAKKRLEIDIATGQTMVAERRSDWPAAALALNTWLNLEPKNGRARQRLAQAFFRLGKRDRTSEELNQAVKDEPNLEPAAVSMAQLYLQEGNHAKTEEWMDYAIKVAPEDPKAQMAYARWLLTEKDQADKAKIHADIAAKADPNGAEGKLLRGLIAWQLRDYEAAETIFQALHQDSPADLTASTYLALSLAAQDSDVKQRRALELAEINTRLYPNSRDTLTAVGWVYYRLKRLPEAERSLRAAFATGSTSSDGAYWLARVLWERGQPDDVKKLLKMALDAPGTFVFRKEAKELMEQAEKKPKTP
jgi:tetratricopeptide (TPR) repeat protein